MQKTKSTIPLEKIDKNTLDSYLAIPISRVFSVSDKVIQIALSELDGIAN